MSHGNTAVWSFSPAVERRVSKQCVRLYVLLSSISVFLGSSALVGRKESVCLFSQVPGFLGSSVPVCLEWVSLLVFLGSWVPGFQCPSLSRVGQFSFPRFLGFWVPVSQFVCCPGFQFQICLLSWVPGFQCPSMSEQVSLSFSRFPRFQCSSLSVWQSLVSLSFFSFFVSCQCVTVSVCKFVSLSVCQFFSLSVCLFVSLTVSLCFLMKRRFQVS